MITASVLKTIFPWISKQDEWARYLDVMFSARNINTIERETMFLAQAGHESAGFTQMIEKLSYSASALMSTWPKRFPSIESTEGFSRQPEKLANKVYADRMGNGPESSGDGWRFRGRGLIQLTGRTSYQACAKSLGVNLDVFPQYLETIPGAVASAGWYWDARMLNQCSDEKDIITCTRRINGGLNGLADRQDIYTRAYAAIKGVK